MNARAACPRAAGSRRSATASFSIAITLLVLELAIPAIRGGFASQLFDEWISYVAYLAGFGSIGVLWMGQSHGLLADPRDRCRTPVAKSRPAC